MSDGAMFSLKSVSFRLTWPLKKSQNIWFLGIIILVMVAFIRGLLGFG